MKQNSQKLLLSLYDPSSNVLWSDYQRLQLFLPELSYAGLRSLVSSLKKKELIYSQSFMGKTSISLTGEGRKELESLFPVFSSRLRRWSGELDCLLFLRSPKTDQSFRYLRTKLVEHNAISLNRGVYVFPIRVPEKIVEECKNSYKGSVLIFPISEFTFGDLHKQILKKYRLQELAELYSGISNEIDQLLSRNKVGVSLNHQEKINISMVFNRIYTIVNNDSGLLPFYFPQVTSASKLLTRLQKIASQS